METKTYEQKTAYESNENNKYNNKYNMSES